MPPPLPHPAQPVRTSLDGPRPPTSKSRLYRGARVRRALLADSESVHRGSTCALIGSAPMTLAEVYKHNASECREAAGRTDNAVYRAMLLKTAREWWQDAEALRASTLRDGKARRLTSAVRQASS
jgi:hypothetical protein